MVGLATIGAAIGAAILGLDRGGGGVAVVPRDGIRGVRVDDRGVVDDSDACLDDSGEGDRLGGTGGKVYSGAREHIVGDDAAGGGGRRGAHTHGDGIRQRPVGRSAGTVVGYPDGEGDPVTGVGRQRASLVHNQVCALVGGRKHRAADAVVVVVGVRVGLVAVDNDTVDDAGDARTGGASECDRRRCTSGQRATVAGQYAAADAAARSAGVGVEQADRDLVGQSPAGGGAGTVVDDLDGVGDGVTHPDRGRPRLFDRQVDSTRSDRDVDGVVVVVRLRVGVVSVHGRGVHEVVDARSSRTRQGDRGRRSGRQRTTDAGKDPVRDRATPSRGSGVDQARGDGVGQLPPG